MNIESEKLQDISLKDLIDISSFQNLSESFTRLTGMATAILDLQGEVLTDSGWKKICTQFHRKNPTTALRCFESDTILASQLDKGEKYNIYNCKNGLVDVAVPIIIDNIHVGNLFTGQFFTTPPDIDFFIRQAEEFSFDKQSYLEALSQVPVISMERVRQAMDFLINLTEIIGHIGLANKKLLNLNRHLEKKVADRTSDLQKEIDSRIKTEADLRASKRFLNSVFNAIQDGISVLDADLNVMQVNQKMHQWHPHLHKSIGEKCYKIYHQRSKPCEICPTIKTLKSNVMEMAEIPLTTKDGVIGTLELYSYPIQDRSGKLTGVVEYVRDITARKNAEKQVEMEKLFSESLINSLPGVMYYFDKLGRIERWNQNFETITGYSAKQIKDMNPLDFIAIEDKDRVRKAIEDVFLKGYTMVEAGLTTISGQVIPYLFTGYRFIQEHSNHLIGVGLDISDRVKVEKEKEYLILKLQDALAQVKQLSGFLPICASCKKIRDDKGYWNQIESYLRDHSEAEFTHSICPECVEKLYPGMNLKE